MVISTAKTSLCDYLAQRYLEGKKEIDLRRNAAFAIFGFVYLGAIQYGLFVNLFSRIWPKMGRFADLPVREKLRDRRGCIELMQQTCTDVFIIGPFLYYPIFYLMKEFVEGAGATDSNYLAATEFNAERGRKQLHITPVESDQPKTASFSVMCHDAYRKMKYNFIEDQVANIGIWIPLNMVGFAVPLWTRLPLRHFFSLMWTVGLSFFRGRPMVLDADEDKAGDTLRHRTTVLR
jgi:hypothetical protein